MVAAAGLLLSVSVGVSKAAPKEGKMGGVRWHGRIVRVNKDEMTMDVRKGTIPKTIHFDSSTQFVKNAGKKTEPIDMSTLKEGDDVICIGTSDEKGDFRATTVQLQPGR
ncbi:MAG: hypothetical protein DMG21_22175 [Acidobacteria bacterium]|nr:MAG: hypothetical protein DMG21_22175 [Acidobacteriota bacterium]